MAEWPKKHLEQRWAAYIGRRARHCKTGRTGEIIAVTGDTDAPDGLGAVVTLRDDSGEFVERSRLLALVHKGAPREPAIAHREFRRRAREWFQYAQALQEARSYPIATLHVLAIEFRAAGKTRAAGLLDAVRAGLTASGEKGGGV